MLECLTFPLSWRQITNWEWNVLRNSILSPFAFVKYFIIKWKKSIRICHLCSGIGRNSWAPNGEGGEKLHHFIEWASNKKSVHISLLLYLPVGVEGEVRTCVPHPPCPHSYATAFLPDSLFILDSCTLFQSMNQHLRYSALLKISQQLSNIICKSSQRKTAQCTA